MNCANSNKATPLLQGDAESSHSPTVKWDKGFPQLFHSGDRSKHGLR